MNKNNILYFTNSFIVILLLNTIFLGFIAWGIYNLTNQINVKIIELNNTEQLILKDSKAIEMRITGYLPTGNKTALMEDVIVGWTAAVSPDCIHMLGSKVYIKGYGIRYVNDLTHPRLDNEFNICTLDIAVPTKEEAYKVGNSTSTVIRIDK